MRQEIGMKTGHEKEEDKRGRHRPLWDGRVIRSLGDEESVDPRERMVAEYEEENAMCFPWDGECTMLIHFPGSLRARRFEKSRDVGPSVPNGFMSPQWCGAWWRRQDTVHKCFVNSTELVFAAMPPCGTIGVTCNQVNFLRNHDGTKSEAELLASLFGVDVAEM